MALFFIAFTNWADGMRCRVLKKSMAFVMTGKIKMMVY